MRGNLPFSLSPVTICLCIALIHGSAVPAVLQTLQCCNVAEIRGGIPWNTKAW
ncbi:hypothetical protein BD410DRAFT_366540 [Rickenella mellea]|uniref:Hydrophobin n=1 Tax=Rickenella mellea TaxID=50990 RepID=A0A4Y7PYR4_9AGAM|nr:hypothetical protein BD410DRAFT_366540 [Rickenella mellea]